MREFLAYYSHFLVTCGQMTSLPGDLQSPEVTWRHFLSHDCLFLRVKPCRKWNAQNMRVFGLLQPLPGDFQSNDVTSGWLSVTWGHTTSYLVTWLPPPVSYSLVGSEMYSVRELLTNSHFQVTFSQMTSLPGRFRSPVITWRHFLSRDCLLLRATAL